MPCKCLHTVHEDSTISIAVACKSFIVATNSLSPAVLVLPQSRACSHRKFSFSKTTHGLKLWPIHLFILHTHMKQLHLAKMALHLFFNWCLIKQLHFKTAVKVLSSCENKKIFICSFFAKNVYNIYSTGWTEWAW